MENCFYNTQILDQKAKENFGLSSEILMEHAARGMKEFIDGLGLDCCVLIVCGSGDNGGDGLALARLLCGSYEVLVHTPFGQKSALCQIEYARCQKIAQFGLLRFCETADDWQANLQIGLVVDCLFGGGFRAEASKELIELLQKLNKLQALKIACDLPTGINLDGNPLFLHQEPLAFRADFTLSMGALKYALLSDWAKDFSGTLHTLCLGISKQLYAPMSDVQLLEKTDFAPPLRKRHNVHKGTFGHVVAFGGEKQGACVLACLAALRMGAGLVSYVLAKEPSCLPAEIMHTHHIPQNSTAFLLGLGFGRGALAHDLFEALLEYAHVPIVLDADIFYHAHFEILLEQCERIILTPHPKEFAHILERLGIACVSVWELQQQRLAYAQKFSALFPEIVLVLKGANTIIAYQNRIFVSNLGNNALAKGGSGDVLAGIIGAYLAQGYGLLESSIQGVLAHALSAIEFTKHRANFSLSPCDLIEHLQFL